MIKATIISLSLLVFGPVLPLETPSPPPRQLAFYPEPFGLQLPEPPPPRKKIYRLQTKYFKGNIYGIKVYDKYGRAQNNFTMQPSKGFWMRATKTNNKKVWIYTNETVVIEEL